MNRAKDPPSVGYASSNSSGSASSSKEAPVSSHEAPIHGEHLLTQALLTDDVEQPLLDPASMVGRIGPHRECTGDVLGITPAPQDDEHPGPIQQQRPRIDSLRREARLQSQLIEQLFQAATRSAPHDAVDGITLGPSPESAKRPQVEQGSDEIVQIRPHRQMQ